MENMYDVIIVGARCAGSPLAMLLARKGYRVLVVDKAAFPSDTVSTHHIHQPGVARLKRWGLIEKIKATNCPATTTYKFDVGPFALTGSPPPIDGNRVAYAPRRRILDNILADAATEAGAELRERFIVEELTTENGRVTGIRGRDQNGKTVIERATSSVRTGRARSSRGRLRLLFTLIAERLPVIIILIGAEFRTTRPDFTCATGGCLSPIRPTTD